MATFTDQMGGLAADILNGHQERRSWLGALRQAVRSLRRDNRAWLGAVRREALALRREVRELVGENEAARRDAATAARKERRTWRGALKKEVRTMRHECRTDRQGARRAWREMIGLVGARRKVGMAAGAEAHAARPRARSKGTSRRGR